MVKVLGNVPAVVTREGTENVLYSTSGKVFSTNNSEVVEVGYAERTDPFSVTPGAAYSTTGNIPGLMVQIVGSGRPVEVEFFAPGLYASSAYIPVMPYVTVNGDTTTGVSATTRSAVTTDGMPYIIKRRIILDDGVTYTFQAGLMTDTPGVALNMAASIYGRAYLSVMTR